MKTLEVQYNEEVDGSHLVTLYIADKEIIVTCQTYTTATGKESAQVSCVNDSDYDYYGLEIDAIAEQHGLDDSVVIDAINECANSHINIISVLDLLKEKTGDYTLKLEKGLFNTFGPADVLHYKYVSSSSDIIVVTSEDNSEIRADKQLLGFKVFPNFGDYEKWFDLVTGNDFSGDCSISYKAYNSICEKVGF